MISKEITAWYMEYKNILSLKRDEFIVQYGFALITD